MSEQPVVYTSKVRIERQFGPNRLAWLPAESEAVSFGVHGDVAKFYGVDVADLPTTHATTLDYIVAATGG